MKEQLDLLQTCWLWMKNSNREKDMRARDSRSYERIFHGIEGICTDVAEYPTHMPRDEEQIVTLLTSCYWLFRLSKREYPPLNEWYEQHKKGQWPQNV